MADIGIVAVARAAMRKEPGSVDFSYLGYVDHQTIQSLLEQFFYPGLLGILVIASLGIPIPEDIPLIAAGVVLKLQPGTATWPGAIGIALIGIMTGDLVLYSLGRFWGRDVVNHRSVRWIITPQRFQRAVDLFRRYGSWFCFFGRFVVGIRAVMCMTAGATHFPYWRFFLADFAGALLSVPFFIGLGYIFAEFLAELYMYLAEAQAILFVIVAALVGGFIWYEVRRIRKMQRERREAIEHRRARSIKETVADPAAEVVATSSCDAAPVIASPPPTHPAPAKTPAAPRTNIGAPS